VEFLGVAFGRVGSTFPTLEAIVKAFPNGKMQKAKDVGELMATFDFILRDNCNDQADKKVERVGEANWTRD
jgi:hypothetical protein